MSRRSYGSSDAEKNAPGESYSSDAGASVADKPEGKALDPAPQATPIGSIADDFTGLAERLATMSLAEQQTLLDKSEWLAILTRRAIAKQSAEVTERDQRDRTFIHAPCKKKILLTRASATSFAANGEIDAFCSMCGRPVKTRDLKPLAAAER